jgi:cell wall-associated NlpC family hydrolase
MLSKNLFPAGGLLLAILCIIALQGCSSLQPVPRFRTSSASFAPEQLPNSQRSPSDLIDVSKVAAYSSVKENASKSDKLVMPEDVRQMVINQSASSLSMHVDEVGLDSEQMDDELAQNEEFGEEEPPVDETVIQRIVQKTYSALTPLDESEELNPSVSRPELMKEIINLLGVHYKYGGTDAVRGLDCSAFTGTIYSRALGVRLPRSSNEQFGAGVKVKRTDLRIGDLVFFKTRHRRRGAVSHVGIYIGEDLFAHSSTRHGVIISPLGDGYYEKTFVGARRVLSAQYGDLSRSPGTKM